MFGFLGRKRLKTESRSICDRGLARTDNQDCVLEDARRGLFCVADGMGGGEAGCLASRIVCEEFSCVDCSAPFEERIVRVDDAILAAHARIRRHAATCNYTSMGATLAAVLFDLALPACAAVVHLGDSRVYRRRGVRFERLTEDHRATRYSHVITRAVGCGATVETDWLHASVQKGDIWLVCSDGVHEMLPDSTLNALLAHGGSAAEMAVRIETSVRNAGARDNYSIIVVKT